VARYPELANVSEPYAQLCFNEATLYCANVLGIVCNPDTLSALLNMLTAHIVKLYSAQTNGQPDSAGSSANPGVVGRVSAATEGSVNVTLEMPNQPAAAAWYLQTSYGASFWAATAVYRTARYVPGDPMRPAFPAGGPYASPYFPWGGRW
jgi:phage tail sheath gpL-like